MVAIITACLTILGLAFIQNISFSIVSRSRNRNNMRYHIIAASFSNVIWFLTFRQLILADMSYIMLPFYGIGTVAGSVYGVKISMIIEKWLGATADGHLDKKTTSEKSMNKTKTGGLCINCKKKAACLHSNKKCKFCSDFIIDEDLLK